MLRNARAMKTYAVCAGDEAGGEGGDPRAALVLRLLLVSLERQPAPNLAHLLCGFDFDAGENLFCGFHWDIIEFQGDEGGALWLVRSTGWLPGKPAYCVAKQDGGHRVHGAHYTVPACTAPLDCIYHFLHNNIPLYRRHGPRVPAGSQGTVQRDARAAGSGTGGLCPLASLSQLSAVICLPALQMGDCDLCSHCQYLTRPV
jgi:hypothetical protein